MENLNNEPFGKEWKREMMKYDQGYAAGYSEANSQAVQEIRDHYSPNR